MSRSYCFSRGSFDGQEVIVATYSSSGKPTDYARVIINNNNPQNPSGVAYYDSSSLPYNENFAKSYDVYVATSQTVYSAVYMSR
jgi:hypothetical protein